LPKENIMQGRDQKFEFRGRTWTTGDVRYPYYPAWSNAGDCLMIICERSPEINGKEMPVYEEEFRDLFAAIETHPKSLAIFEQALYGPNNAKPDPYPTLDRINFNNINKLLDLVRSSRAIGARAFVDNLTAATTAYNAERHAFLNLREATAHKILDEVSGVLLQDEHASLEDLRESLEELAERLWDSENADIGD
jgi:hypothetical protein